MAPEDAADVLLAWCDAQGVIIDDRIRVVRGDEGDIAVFSDTDTVIERGTTLVTIPKTCILSIKSCALSDFIEPVIYGREAQLGLALGVYGELLKGAMSLWAGYLHSLPDTVDLAYFWNDVAFDGDEDTVSAREWVKGTMAERELQGRNASSPSSAKSPKHMNDLGVLDDVRRYFDTVAESALGRAGLVQSATFRGYRHAFALVSSRAFFVDAYHGLAMVPIADAFNHCLENQVHLESDYDVCPACGSLAECPHDAEDGNDTEEEEARDGHRTQCLDDPDTRTPKKQTRIDAENTCEMVTNASVAPFGEVWNTYGERLTNAELLVRYGFVLDSNENDVIAWDPRDLGAFVSGVLGEAEGADASSSCEAADSDWDSDDRLFRRTLLSSPQYQSPDSVGGERDRTITIIRREKEEGEEEEEARTQVSPKTGVSDDRRLPDGPGSLISTARPHTAPSLIHKRHIIGTESGVFNTDADTDMDSGTGTADDCSAAQGILERLDELISRWHCGSSDMWRSSRLVYEPFSREADADAEERHGTAECERCRRRRRSWHPRVEGEDEYEKEDQEEEEREAVADVDDIASRKTVPNTNSSSTPSTPGGLRGEEAIRTAFENSASTPAATSAVAALGARTMDLDLDLDLDLDIEDHRPHAERQARQQAQLEVGGDREDCHNEDPGPVSERLFALNDEARMSHHLWLFCVVLALELKLERGAVCVCGLEGPSANRDRDPGRNYPESTTTVAQRIDILRPSPPPSSSSSSSRQAQGAPVSPDAPTRADRDARPRSSFEPTKQVKSGATMAVESVDARLGAADPSRCREEGGGSRPLASSVRLLPLAGLAQLQQQQQQEKQEKRQQQGKQRQYSHLHLHLQLGSDGNLKRRADPLFPARSRMKSKSRLIGTNANANTRTRRFSSVTADLELVKRIARAQVRLEELCEALAVEEENEEEEEEGGSGARSDSLRTRSESFARRRIGSAEVDGEGRLLVDDDDDGTPLESALAPMADASDRDADGGQLMRTSSGCARARTVRGSAIDAIKDYGDSEDEEDELELQFERQPEERVQDPNEDDIDMMMMVRGDAERESASASKPGTRIRGSNTTTAAAAIAYEHQTELELELEEVMKGGRRRDDSNGGSFAGAEGERARKRRRRQPSDVHSMQSPTSTRHHDHGAGIPPVYTDVVARSGSGSGSRRASGGGGVPQAGSDLGAGQAINLGRRPEPAIEAREAPPPPPSMSMSMSISRPISVPGTQKPSNRDRDRTLALALAGGHVQPPSPRPTDARYYGCDRVVAGGVASDGLGDDDGDSGSTSGTRGRAGAVGEAAPAANSVSGMMMGKDSGKREDEDERARLVPVAFGVRLDVEEQLEDAEANPIESATHVLTIPVGPEVTLTLSPAHATPAGASSRASLSPDPPDDALADVDVELVASIARVVAALSKRRAQSMHVPDADARALGELADAIPGGNTKTRLAAQLALAERSLLESWAAAWAEFGARLAALAKSEKSGKNGEEKRKGKGKEDGG